MEWVFASVVFLVLVYFMARHPIIRKRVLLVVGGLVGLAAIAGALAYVHSERLERRARSLIRPVQITLEGVTLAPGEVIGSYTSPYWTISGKATNASDYPVQSFRLTTVVQDCPEPNTCVIVGQADDAAVWVDIPPKQLRAFSTQVRFANMPKLTSWKWHFVVTEVRAKTD